MNTTETERRAAHEGALLQSAPDLGALVVTGSERQSWLNGMVTCEVAKLEPGSGAYGLAVAKVGKILAELWILVAKDRVIVGVNRGRLDALREHLDKHLIMEDAEIADASSDIDWLFVHGPLAKQAADVARSAGGPDVYAASFAWTDLGNAAIAAPRSAIQTITDAIRSELGERACLVTPAGFEQLRIEEGIARYGVDFDDQTYPQEASLERLAVSFQKGCYLGQETVFMLEMRGHAKKRLVQLTVDGEGEIPIHSEIVLPDGASVGEVTSQTKAPDGAHVITLGYVKYKYAQQGAQLLIAGRPALITKAPPTKSE